MPRAPKPPRPRPPAITAADVARALERLFINAAGTTLRREDQKKALEVAALLRLLAASVRPALLVDAAAGKASVGLLALELLAVPRLCVIERDPARSRACRDAATRLARPAEVDVRTADVSDPRAWPDAPDAVVALHACGAASDLVLDRAVACGARWIFLVPCCYATSVPFAPRAEALADAQGVSRHAEIRRRAVTALIDTERALRLESAGYETTVLPFVPPTVTPHNLLFRARRVGEAGAMSRAHARLRALQEG